MADDILSLNRSDFNATLRELADQGMDTTFLRQKYREQNSPFAGLLDYASRQQNRITEAGRRPIMGGLLSKPVDAVGMDAITQAEFEPAAFISGLLSGGAQAIDAPAAAMRGDLTREEAEQAALGTAGMMLGGGAAIDAGRRISGRKGVTPVSEAAMRAYQVGGSLSSPSGFVGPLGKPSKVNILGESYEARPISAIEDAAAEYMRKRGMDASPIESYPAFSEERGRLIAAAYDQMKHDPSNPDVKRAYDAMIGETLDQYNALKGSGIDFKFIPEGMADPYAASPAMGYKDLVENGRLWVFPTDQGFGTLGADVADNPLLARVGRIGDLQDATANDAFRAVHDAFGHFGSGNPFFRRQGEERAFLEHQRMYSPDARGAMTSETRGQNSWLNSGPYATANRSALGADTVFADQKTGLLSPWTAEPSGMPDAIERAALEEYIRRMAWQ